MKISSKDGLGNYSETDMKFGHSDDIMNEVPNVIAWLKSKKLPVHVSRYSKYQKYIEDFYDQRDKDHPSEEKFKILNWAFQELYEIVQVYKCFCDEDSDDFNKRLKKVVSGQDLTPDTIKAKNDNSRDFLYELLIAFEFKSRGFSVCFNHDADVVAIRGLDVIMAECKRLSSNNSLERNLKKAGEQLSVRDRKDTYGLIFIDISCCLEDKIPVYEYRSDAEMISTVRKSMGELLHEYRNMLEYYANKFIESALGICLTFRRTLWIGQGDYFRVNYYTDKNIHISKDQTVPNEEKLIDILGA